MAVTAVSRTVMFAPGPAAAAYGWWHLGEPYHAAGLAAVAAAGLAAWPLAVMAGVFGLPAVVLCLLPPRPVRRWWRGRNPGLLCWLAHWVTGTPVGRDGARSSYIPAWLKRVVLGADRWRCVYCHSKYELNIDHVGPWSLGYLTVLFNLMTLCRACNLAKSNAWVFHGRFWAGHSGNPALAEAIVRFERRYRWYAIARWLRAAWTLGA
jgi:HNH endonuclease